MLNSRAYAVALRTIRDCIYWREQRRPTAI